MDFFSLLRSVAIVSSVVSGLTLLISFLFSLWMMPADFGEYTYWYSVYLISINLIQFGSVGAASIYRYQVGADQYKAIISCSLFSILPIMLLSVILGMYGINNLFGFFDNQILYFAPLSAFFYIPTLLLLTIYRVEQNISSYFLLYVALSLSLFVTQFVCFFITKDYLLVILSFVMMQFFFSLYALFYLYRVLGIHPGLLISANGGRLLIEQFSYGFPLVLSSVGMSVLSMGDKLYLKDFISAQNYGEYAKAALLGALVLFLVNNFAMAWGGFLTKKICDSSNVEVGDFFMRGQAYVVPIFIVGAVVISLGLLGVHRVFYGRSDGVIKLSIAALVISYLLYGASKFYIGFMLVYKKNVEVLKGTLIGLCIFIFVCISPWTISMLKAPVALMLGFLSQLAYVCVYTNLKLRGEF